MKLTLYRMATTLGGPLIRYYLNRRLLAGKEDEDRFPERLGIASLPRPKGKLVWIHAASVGESLSVLPLIDRLGSDFPDAQVLVTTGTVTSARLMLERLPPHARHQFIPVDRVSYVRRFLEHWKPDLALWMESEFWPNLVIETRASAVPMVVLNGRMSERSFTGWRKSRSMIQRILSSFRLVLAQSETDGERFSALGAKDVRVPGNIKFAGAPLPVDDDDLAALTTQIGDRPVWLAASTHAGEEALCGRVHREVRKKVPDLLTIIVPRHPDRGPAITDELQALGVSVARRSSNQTIQLGTDVYVADTLGELGLFYRLSPLVLIGKSLLGHGGQNPIEPAMLDCALMFGPDMSNFADIAEKLLKAKAAFTVGGEDDLRDILSTLVNDATARNQATKAARAVAQSEAHVLDRVMDALAPYLNVETGAPHART